MSLLAALLVAPALTLHPARTALRPQPARGPLLQPRFAAAAARPRGAIGAAAAAAAGGVWMQEGLEREKKAKKGGAAVVERPKAEPKQMSKEEIANEPMWRLLIHNDDVRQPPQDSPHSAARRRRTSPTAGPRLGRWCHRSAAFPAAKRTPSDTTAPLGLRRAAAAAAAARVASPNARACGAGAHVGLRHLRDRLGRQDGHAEEGPPHHNHGAIGRWRGEEQPEARTGHRRGMDGRETDTQTRKTPSGTRGPFRRAYPALRSSPQTPHTDASPTRPWGIALASSPTPL